jgi:hypothetical protein
MQPETRVENDSQCTGPSITYYAGTLNTHNSLICAFTAEIPVGEILVAVQVSIEETKLLVGSKAVKKR